MDYQRESGGSTEARNHGTMITQFFSEKAGNG